MKRYVKVVSKPVRIVTLKHGSLCTSLTDVGSNMERFAGCEVCQYIMHLLTESGSAGPMNLGSAEEALATNCQFHKPLTKAFVDFLSGQGSAPLAGLDDLGIGSRPPPAEAGECVYLTESVSKGGRSWPLLLVNKKTVPDHPGTGRVMDQDWADLGLLKSWKDECLLSHRMKCENPLKIWHTRPAWLIDVDEKCLVPGSVDGPLVALSYMYGRHHEAVRIDKRMLHRLQDPGSLDSTNDVSERLVSPIIRHAMSLTAIIGERYLWVDAICITHNDDTDSTTEQLRQMGAIYANAIVTIIATDGDSQDGLPGIEGVSNPRRGRIHQRVFSLGDEQIIVRRPWTLSASYEKPYHTRGWTYQEERMAQRKIIFHNHQLHWECQCAVCHEEIVPGARTDEWIEPFLKAIVNGFPSLNALDGLIYNYNQRKLRYDEDALPAISGVLSVMSRSFTGGFLYGIPEMFFDRVLGWRALLHHRNLRRRERKESTEPRDAQFSESGLPSWSWVGWDGFVSIDFCREEGMGFYMDRFPERFNETIPITEWFTGDNLDTPQEKRRRIRSTWFEHRDELYKDFSRPLPPGWTRHDMPKTTNEELRLYPDGCDKYFFTHKSGTSWFYPFPVTKVDESTSPFVPTQTRYLFCETKRARLWSHQVGAEGDFLISSVENDAGRMVGELYLHSWDDLACFPEKTSAMRNQPGMPVEVVAINKSQVHSRMTKGDESSNRLSSVSYHTYTVLWVEWKDGVAYRRASGEVNGDEWESLDLEPVSLVLG